MTPISPRWKQFSLAILLVSSLAAHGCASGSAVVLAPITVESASPSPAVAWLAPNVARDLGGLVRWRRSVGPPETVTGTAPVSASATDKLIVVSWNTHVGGGDIARLYSDVRRHAGSGVPIVMLLQETYRGGPAVPKMLEPGSMFASLIHTLKRDGGRDEVGKVAAALGLYAYYVPSMRNGGPLTSDEDRGNAIVSTLPLTDLGAIELPFERQRHVAVAATVSGTTVEGRPWRVRVVSAHFDTMGGARRLWIAGGEFVRARQARGLVTALENESPLVLGADMNTLFGFREGAYAAAARAFPGTSLTDRRPTFRGLLRLDHMFFRLDRGWKADFRRGDDDFGSDHYPLIGTIDFTTATP